MLKSLDLSHNKLEAFPEQATDNAEALRNGALRVTLPRLRRPIDHMPININFLFYLVKLERLDLRHNNLRVLPVR